MDKFFESITKHIKAIFNLLVIILITLGSFWVYQTFFGYYVLVRFKELGPLTKNMAVYYNGFVIGKTTSVEPDEDYKASIVKIILNHKNTKLPRNTFVLVGQFPNGQNYLQFIYPATPALKLMEKGDVLEGITSYSLEQFMHGQAYSGAGDIVSENVSKTLTSADETNRAMRIFFENSSEVLKENRQNIKETTKNTARMTASLAQTAENLNITSQKLNKSIDENNFKSSTSNINKSTENIMKATENIKTTTEDINRATKDIDKTVKKLDSTMSEVHATASNMNKITTGIHQVLGKRFAGMRIMFGKPIPTDETQNNCNKN